MKQFEYGYCANYSKSQQQLAGAVERGVGHGGPADSPIFAKAVDKGI